MNSRTPLLRPLSCALAIVVAWPLTSQAESLAARYQATILKAPVGENALVVADFNGDEHLDFALVGEDQGTGALYIGDGDGEFTVGKTFKTGDNPTHLEAADIDSDGIMDLVIANHETDFITLLRGDGKSGFTEFDFSPLKINVDPHPHFVRLADFDADGNPDLLVDHRTGGGVLLIGGSEDGKFSGKQMLINGGGDPYLGFAVGDVNRDGRLDIVTPNPGSIGVVLGSAEADKLSTPPKLLATRSPFAVTVADINADGFPDIVSVSEPTEPGVTFWLADGEGSFLESDGLPLQGGAKKILHGDFNGDKVQDLLITSWSGQIALVSGGSDIERDKFEHDIFEDSDITAPWSSASGDLNGDGVDDVIITDGVKPLLKIFLSEGAGEG